MSRRMDRLRTDPVLPYLRQRVGEAPFSAATIVFVVGYPRSDIGKGQLIARLPKLFKEDGGLVKFDGMLNTNVSGNHPSPSDDLGTYAKHNSNVSLGWPHQILGGEVVRDFIHRYGGTDHDHLSFVPHLSTHFIDTLRAAWVCQGSPEVLFVELGGTLADAELSTYAIPGVLQLIALGTNVRVLLLTEAAYSGGQLKTRSIQLALECALQQGLHFDAIFVRVAEEAGEPTSAAPPAEILDRLTEVRPHAPRVRRLFAVPRFPEPHLDGYDQWLAGVRFEIADVLGVRAASTRRFSDGGRDISDELRPGAE